MKRPPDSIYLLHHMIQCSYFFISQMPHVCDIYLDLGDFVRANVGKDSSTMEHIGYVFIVLRRYSFVNRVFHLLSMCVSLDGFLSPSLCL